MPQSKSRKIAILGYRSVGKWARAARLGEDLGPAHGRADQVFRGGAAMCRAARAGARAGGRRVS